MKNNLKTNLILFSVVLVALFGWHYMAEKDSPLAARTGASAVVADAPPPLPRRKAVCDLSHCFAVNWKTAAVADIADVDIEARDGSGRTALMLAAQWSKDPAIIRALLGAGADVNARSKSKWTALMLAVRFNENPEIVRALLGAGADANARDKSDLTALMLAAAANLRLTSVNVNEVAPFSPDQEGHAADGIAEFFFNNKGVASPGGGRYDERIRRSKALLFMQAMNLLSSNGRTIGYSQRLDSDYAGTLQKMRQKDLQLMQVLGAAQNNGESRVTHDGREYEMFSNGAWALNLANGKKVPATRTGQFAQKLADNPKVLTRLLNGNAALQASLQEQSNAQGWGLQFDIEERVLWREYAVLMADDYSRIQALEFGGKFKSSANEKLDIIPALLDAGAEVNARAKSGWTALMFAVGNENPETVRMLLKAGAAIETRNQHGETALMLAAWRSGNPKTIRALLQAGADIKARSTDGLTPLMFAASLNQNSAVIRALLKAGADIKAIDTDGRTVLMRAARENTSVETLRVLLKAAAKMEARRKAKNRNVGSLPFLGGASVSCPSQWGRALTVLTSIHACDKYGMTALMLAAQNNENSDVILALLDAGAGAKTDNNGKTAWDYIQTNKALKDTPAYWKLNDLRY